MPNWRALLLVYPRLDLLLSLARQRQTRLTNRLTEAECEQGVQSFTDFPALASELTGGSVKIETIVRFIDRPLGTLTLDAERPRTFWPSPDDTRQELNQFAPAGGCESVFVYWPQHDFAADTAIPTRGWGLGMEASAWSNDATYATVANAPSAAWEMPRSGEVWLHEWLHGVCAQYSRRGIPMPDGDADGAERHGYVRSAETGWCDYYRDLMKGCVPEAGQRKGIPLTAWNALPFDRAAGRARPV